LKDGGLAVIKCDDLPGIGEERKEKDEAKMAEQFLSKNPTPILKVGEDGTVLYTNKAANVILDYWGIKEGDKVPQPLRHNIKRALSQESPENIEIQTGKTTYAVLIHPFPEEDYVNIQGFDISSRILAEEKLHRREKQYLSLSNLGRMSIACKDFQAILEKSARLIAQGLDTEFSTILELMPDGNFIVRAGSGWEEGLAGNTIIRGKEESHSGYTLLARKPVILKDLETETRFKHSELLRSHGIVCGITVLIGNVSSPFGVLGVYSTVKRDFTEDDIYFLDSAALLLSEIIERLKAEEKLRVHHQELEKLVEKRTLEYTEANEKLAQEVTQRREIERTLMNTVSFLEALLDSIPSPVFQRDLNAIYVNCNESFARQIMGLPKNLVIGGSFQEFEKRIPKELAEIYKKYDRELIRDGGSHYHETMVVCADGMQRDFLFHKATYEDSSGEIAGVVGVMLDITQLKEAEKTSRKSEERYRIAAEQTGQLVYDCDAGSGKIDWAGAILQITGYNPEEFKHLDLEGWLANIHEEDWEKARETHEKFMKTG
jgi:PAS domain S-box-containing protein